MQENKEPLSSSLRPLIIIGAGGHAVSVANVAMSAGYDVRHFVDDGKVGVELLGVKVIGSLSELTEQSAFTFAIAVGDNAVRERIYHDISIRYPSLSFPPLVHASAVISVFTEIGEGTVVMPNCVVGPNSRVGKFCLINTRASIDHDCEMSDFSSLAPSVATGGGVRIGVRSAVSIGAAIKHGVTIGADSVVGACSYVNKDLPGNVVAYGVPARAVRARSAGDIYLK